MGAQARLDMADWNFMIKGAETAHKGTGRVALHENCVEPVSTEDLSNRAGERGREIPEALAWTHDAEIKVGSDAKAIEDLSSHFGMLGCRDGERLERVRRLQATDHRGKFDRLRTSSNDQGDGFFVRRREFFHTGLIWNCTGMPAQRSQISCKSACARRPPTRKVIPVSRM